MTNSLDNRRLRLLGGCAVAALALAAVAPALAQTSDEAEPTDVEELVVTGYRGSVERSIEVKRQSDLIVETVSAEDIGKLPDNSIAEAIARLPGLTAQRLDGRAQTISIRGLSADFSTTLLNGREQTTAGDNRGVEFDQYPSEIMSSVVVYKTPDASIVGQGLSGTVDLRTIRPLAFGRRALSFGLRGEMLDLGKLNPDSKDQGYRANFTYVDQFANDTIGVAFGVAHLESPTQIERFNAWGYPTVDAAGTLALGGAKPYVVSTNLVRTGVIGTVEYQPTEHFNTTIDAFYSDFSDEQNLRGIEFPLFWGGRPLEPGYTAQNGFVTHGQYNGVKAVVRNDANTRDAKVLSLGWNTRWNDNGWTVVGDASYSRVKRTDQIIETYAGTGRPGFGATDNVTFDYVPGEGFTLTPTLDYANASLIQLTSPQGWGGDVIPGGQDGYYNSPTIVDELYAFRGSVERELSGPFRSIEVGGNYTGRQKELDQNQFFLGLKANAADPLHQTSVPVPSEFLLDPTELGYLNVPGMVSYDPIALINSGIYNLVRNPNADVAAAGWQVTENVATGYAKLNIDTDVGAARLTGNLGFQIVHTDQSSDGFAASGNGAALVGTPVTDGVDYTEFLPSGNFSFRFPGDHVLRFAASRQMARTRMDDMRASINFNYNPNLAGSPDINNSPWGGSGGNPRLKPFLAKALDVTYEKYFGNKAYFSLGAFYKHLDNYVANVNTLYDFSGFPVPSGPEPILREGLVNLPVNRSGGFIRGIESAVSVQGSLLNPMLDGFGASASLSYTESEITPDPAAASITVPGLSKYVANVIVYYEKNGFSARTSLRYRSSFLGEVAGFGNGRTYRQAMGEAIVDAQVGYEFQHGPLTGLSILLQGNNLTDEPFVTYEANDPRRIIDYQRFGRRFLFGFTYKM
jgi:iron complex outermembrane recepter protein